MALINSEKRTGFKLGSKLDQYVKKHKEIRKERRKKFLAKFAKKKEELKPISDEVFINSDQFKQCLEEFNAQEDIYDSESSGEEFLDAEGEEMDGQKKKRFKFGDGARFLAK